MEASLIIFKCFQFCFMQNVCLILSSIAAYSVTVSGRVDIVSSLIMFLVFQCDAAEAVTILIRCRGFVPYHH